MPTPSRRTRSLPGRAPVLTGLYTHNHRVFDVEAPWGFRSFDDRSTLATWLRGGGYETIWLGKYLNGYSEMPRPGATTGGSVRYVPPGWTDWRASLDGGVPSTHPAEGSTYDMFDTTLSANGAGLQSLEGRYQTTAYGDISERVIRASAGIQRPFFFYASYTAPHSASPHERDDPPVVVEPCRRGRWNSPAAPGEGSQTIRDRARR